MKAHGPLKLFKERVPPRGEAGRMSRRDMGSEKVQIMKGPLNAFKYMFRNAPQEVVCESIVSTKEACGDWAAVPAGMRQGGGEVAFEGKPS